MSFNASTAVPSILLILGAYARSVVAKKLLKLSRLADSHSEMEMPHYGYSGVGSPSPEWRDITDRCKSTVEELFAIAEELYGDRVNRIPVSVFEAKCDGPQTFFGKAFGDAKIRIQEIPDNVNGNQRRYQLAQEIIHCLSPVPPNELTFFEKGLAQVFAHCPRVSVSLPQVFQ